MFNTVIKHYIYEKCIDVFFDNIINNFSAFSSRFKIGETYKSIIIKQKTEFIEVDNVRILNIAGNILFMQVSGYREYDLDYNLQNTIISWDHWNVDIDEIVAIIK